MSTRGQMILWPLTQDSHGMTVSNISSKATKLIVTKFHIQPLGVEETKIFSNPPGHITNMASMPVYSKNL